MSRWADMVEAARGERTTASIADAVKASGRNGSASHRSRLGELLRGDREWTPDAVRSVAAALDIPEADALAAYAADLGIVEPAFATVRRHLVEHHAIRAERGEMALRIDASGSAYHVRRYVGLTTQRPTQTYAVSDRAVGIPPTAGNGINVSSAPSIPYSASVSVRDGWRVYHVDFARPWTAADGPIDLELTHAIKRAMVPVDAPGWDRELRQREPAASTTQPHGSWRQRVRHPVETLALRVELPDGYPCTWQQPTATPSEPVDDAPLRPDGNCSSYRWTPDGSTATLIVEQPLPGYVYQIHWTPTALAPPTSEADEETPPWQSH